MMKKTILVIILTLIWIHFFTAKIVDAYWCDSDLGGCGETWGPCPDYQVDATYYCCYNPTGECQVISYTECEYTDVCPEDICSDKTLFYINSQCGASGCYGATEVGCPSIIAECLETICGGDNYWCTYDGGLFEFRTENSPDRCYDEPSTPSGCYDRSDGCDMHGHHCAGFRNCVEDWTYSNDGSCGNPDHCSPNQCTALGTYNKIDCSVQGQCQGSSIECDYQYCDGTICSGGSCVPGLCDNTDHCSGNTYYDGYTCDGSGGCTVDSGDIGCCQGSYCTSGQYCRQSDHSCQPLPDPVCNVRDENGYGYSNAVDGTTCSGTPGYCCSGVCDNDGTTSGSGYHGDCRSGLSCVGVGDWGYSIANGGLGCDNFIDYCDDAYSCDSRQHRYSCDSGYCTGGWVDDQDSTANVCNGQACGDWVYYCSGCNSRRHTRTCSGELSCLGDWTNDELYQSCNPFSCSDTSCSNTCEASCGSDGSCDGVTGGTCPSDGYICNNACEYLNRDTTESYCTDSTGCTAFSWDSLSREFESGTSSCCGDDVGNEERINKICKPGVCTSDSSDWCCGSVQERCADDGQCYSNDELHDVDEDGWDEICKASSYGEWEDGAAPRWSDDFVNNTFINEPALFSLKWTDDIGLSGYTFSFNNGTEKRFGKTDVGGTDWYDPGDIIVCSEYNLPEAASVSKISVYVYFGNRLKCAIYDMSGNLIGETEEKDYIGGWDWVDFMFSPTLLLDPGNYYLCVFWEEDCNIMYDSGSQDQTFHKDQIYTDGFPTSITIKDGEYNREVSIYANYTILVNDTWIPFYEDFTTYIEVDDNNHLDLTKNHVDFDAWEDEDCYLYKDKGVDHFTDFEHLINVKLTAAPDPYAVGAVWALTNDVEDMEWLQANHRTFLSVRFWLYGSTRRLVLNENYDGTSFEQYYDDPDIDKWYYLKIIKEGTDFRLEIYDEPERTTLLDTLSLTLHGDWNFRYIFAANTYNWDSANHIEMSTENLNLQDTSGWSNVTKILNKTAGSLIQWQVYANDTTDNWNVSDMFSFVTRSHYIDVKSTELSYWDTDHWVTDDPLSVNPIAGSNRLMNVTVVVDNSTPFNTCPIRIFNSLDAYSNPSIGPFLGTISRADTRFKCEGIWNMEYWRNPEDNNWNVSVDLGGLVVEESTVGYWKFEENMLDSSMYGNDGSCTSCPSSVEGRFGSAYDFNGFGNYIEIPDDNSLDQTNAITVEIWANADTFGNWRAIVDKSGSEFSDSEWWLGYEDDNTLEFKFNGDDGSIVTGITQINTPGWHQLVGVYNGTHIYIYVDGALDCQPELYVDIETKPGSTVNIGYTKSWGGFYFNGKLDEFRIWNRALSSEEIEASYYTGKAINFTSKKFTYMSLNSIDLYESIDPLTSFGQNIEFYGNPGQTVLSGNAYPVYVQNTGNVAVDLKINGDEFRCDKSPCDEPYPCSAGYPGISSDHVEFRERDENTRGYWKFDEGSGDVVSDESSYANDGILGDGTCSPGSGSCPTWSSVDCKVGNCLLFDGIDDYITVLDSDSLDVTGYLTIELWIKMNSIGGTQFFVEKGANDWDNYGFHMCVGDELSFEYRNPSGVYNHYSTSEGTEIDLQPNVWYHIAIVFDNNYVRLYRNGEEVHVDNANGDLLTNDNDLLIGKQNYGASSRHFHGIMDEVRIWNRALSPDEIYNSWTFPEETQNAWTPLVSPPSHVTALSNFVKETGTPQYRLLDFRMNIPVGYKDQYYCNAIEMISDPV